MIKAGDWFSCDTKAILEIVPFQGQLPHGLEPIYTAVSIKKLCTDKQTYLNTFVKMNNNYHAVSYYRTNKGGVNCLCKGTVDGTTYYVMLVLENYEKWNWETGKSLTTMITKKKVKTIGGKGKVTAYQKYLSYGVIPYVTLDQLDWTHD